MVFDPYASETEQHKELGARLSTFSQGQEERLAEHRAQELGLPYINLVVFPIDSDVLERIPKQDAIRAQAVLFYKQGSDVRVGTSDPTSPEVQVLSKYIEEHIGYVPHLYVVSNRSVAASIARYRREASDNVAPQGELRIGQEDADAFSTELKNLEELLNTESR